MKSPIRYFGGKGGMFQEILKFFPSNHTYDTYIEPYAGAASILFQKEPSPIEIYNDLEENVYSLFKVLADKKLFKQFKEKCDISLYSAKLREEYKRELRVNEKMDIVDRAYKYFYVNRTSVNGVGGFGCATAVIRRNMSKSVSDFLSSIDNLFETHNRLSRVIIENRDAFQIIKKYDRDRVFFYMDPPYHFSTRTNARYKIDMEDEKQKEFIQLLLSVKRAKVLLSGYDCKEYNDLVSNGWQKLSFKVNTMDGNRKPKKKTETVWRNYESIEKEQSIFNI